MATITHTDYLFQQGTGGALNLVPGVWVRLLNNSTAVNYYSTAVTDATSAFTHSAVPGDYSLYTGSAATVVGTPTLRNAHYSVPVTAGDDAVLGSGTTLSTGPYAANLPGAPSIPTPAGVFAGPHWDYGGMTYNVKTFGAKGDGKQLSQGVAGSNGTMTATSAVLTSASNPWTAADVLKLVYVPGAGVGGTPLITTIASYQNPGQVTLTVAASTSVTTANVSWATDDSAAILAAVNAAGTTVVGGRGARNCVSFPPGIFGIASSGVLTPTNATSTRAGLHYQGSGKNTSILQLYPIAGTDIYFYDNVATPRTQYGTLSDLGFWGMNNPAFATYLDIPANSKGFRIWATSATGANEQGFKWRSCYFWGLAGVYESQGDNVTSEMGWVQCTFAEIGTLSGGIPTSAWLINNPQSYDHEFINCDFNDIYGHVFTIGALGGGAVKAFGGSCTMQSGTGVTTYFWNQAGIPASGASGDMNTFDGLKFELLGNFTNLVLIGGVGYQNVNFLNADIHDLGLVTKAAWVTIKEQSQVFFQNVSFVEGAVGTLQFVCAGAVGAYGIDGEIGFERCNVPVDWSERCTLTNGIGHIYARGLSGTNIGALGAGVHYSQDFDYRQGTALGQVGVWLADGTVKNSNSTNRMSWQLKIGCMKLESEQWPIAVGSEHTLKLPKGAIIKGIHIRKPPRGGDSVVANLQVTNNGKTVVHVATNSATWGPNSHIADVDNYYYCVGDTVGERTLRLSVVGAPTQVLYGGLAIVEYY